MNAASYIGRVGGLAVAFGVGTAIITGQGIAVATADGDAPSDNSQTGDGSGNNTAAVNDNAPDDVGKIAVKPSGIADVTGRHSATDTTPTSVTATSIVKRLSDSAEDAVKRVTDVLQNAAGATTTGDKNTPLTTSSWGESSSHANRRAERLAARTTLPDPSPTDSDADNVVANGSVNRAPAIKDLPASPPADTAPPVSTQSSLLTPPRILDAPLFTMEAAPTASVSVERPNLLATVLGNVFNPFAGTAPNAPTPESPLSWVMAATVRRQLSGAAVTLEAPSPIPISPTLLLHTITPVYPETVTGLYNITTPPPGGNQSIQGYNRYNVVDANGNTGTFYAYETSAPYLVPHFPATIGLGFTDKVLYVDSGIANLLGESPGTLALPDGTVISMTSSGGRIVNIYSAIPSPDGNHANDVVSYIATNTRTGRTVNMSWLVHALNFNAADLTPALPDYITSDVDPTVTAISGLPPYTVAVQGYQTFNYLDEDGNTIGHFNALVTTTADGIGFHTEALLITGYPETGRGDAPPIGSVYNTINWGNLSHVYSSIPQDDGTNKITVILTNTRNGRHISYSRVYRHADASKGLLDGTNFSPFDFGDGYTIAPIHAQEVFTGINGLPPGNAVIQGVQVFEVMQGGVSVGTFTAYVATIPTMFFSNHAEGLLVTDSSTSAVPVGSVFDVQTLAGGFEGIYSDIVGAGANGQNLITYTLRSPQGRDIDATWLVGGLDAAAGLDPTVPDPFVSYTNGEWLGLFSQF